MPSPSGFEVSDSIEPAAPEKSGMQGASLFQSGNLDYFLAVEASFNSTSSDPGANSMLNGFELDFESDSSSPGAGGVHPEAGDVHPGSGNVSLGAGDDHPRNTQPSNAEEKPDERDEPTRHPIRSQEQPNEDKQESETCSTSALERDRGGLVGILEGLLALQQRQHCDQEIAEIRARNERRRQLPP